MHIHTCPLHLECDKKGGKQIVSLQSESPIHPAKQKKGINVTKRRWKCVYKAKKKKYQRFEQITRLRIFWHQYI